ncbi:MAG: hypothetical protein Q8T09_00695 [Candidatus Melainabacteria bacterium]|nr:hypothetical protein [Candidatus Melainabacteria bacterium]
MPTKQVLSKRSNLPASTVKGDSYPQWLMKLLKSEYPKRSSWPEEDDYNYFQRASKQLFGRIGIDHWGTTNWHGLGNCFVTEPYGVQLADVEVLKEKGRERDFVVVHDPISYHNPGDGCQRVLIFPRYLSPFKSYEPPVLKAMQDMGFDITDEAPKPKALSILESKAEDIQALESFVKNRLGLSTIGLFNRPFVVTKTEDGFKFFCSKQQAYKLKLDLNVYKKWMRDLRDKSNLPIFTIEIIDDVALVPAREHTFDSNEGLFVDALRLTFVLSASIPAVEKVLQNALGDRLVSISQGEPDIYDERHLTIKLSDPISKKVAAGLISQLKPKMASIRTSGYFKIPW